MGDDFGMSGGSEPLQYLVPMPARAGETVEVSPGIYCIRTSLPFRLSAVNLWLLRDDDGWTMVDCGFPLPQVREQIEAAWIRTLGGAPVTRLIITHHHPDHSGNCRWICERWGITPSMSAGEYASAQELMGRNWSEQASSRIKFWRSHGLSSDAASEVWLHWGRHRQHFRSLPDRWQTLSDGDALRIGGTEWQLIVVHGHSPEQAVLHSPEKNVLISGDQVLPKITPNVSVFAEHPYTEPLDLFLSSNRRIADICGEVLVLPSHNVPFKGLHSRIREIEIHHQERLAKIVAELRKGPKSAATFLPILFEGQLNGHEIGFAIGEVIAHLRHLVACGQARSLDHNGLVLFKLD
jgi:glyoxylase-like metal-dependent hydrolase (beta-lactamase superfamily II)